MPSSAARLADDRIIVSKAALPGRDTMTAREIAAALGSARRSGEWWRCVYLTGRGTTIPVPASLRRAPSLRRPDGTCTPGVRC